MINFKKVFPNVELKLRSGNLASKDIYYHKSDNVLYKIVGLEHGHEDRIFTWNQTDTRFECIGKDYLEASVRVPWKSCLKSRWDKGKEYDLLIREILRWGRVWPEDYDAD
jgi:hypothetical protein